MKPYLLSLLIAVACGGHPAQGQNMFVYDQESSDESRFREGEGRLVSNQPFGQSFTPSLTSVGFIRMYVSDGRSDNNIGATLSVNLRADSITGPILASTEPVLLPDSFARPVDFFFQNAVTVTPGSTYFFQPVEQRGDDSFVNASILYNYAGGTAFFNGTPSASRDLWFREGIVVPEPSSAWLFLAGLSAVAFACRRLI